MKTLFANRRRQRGVGNGGPIQQHIQFQHVRRAAGQFAAYVELQQSRRLSRSVRNASAVKKPCSALRVQPRPKVPHQPRLRLPCTTHFAGEAAPSRRTQRQHRCQGARQGLSRSVRHLRGRMRPRRSARRVHNRRSVPDSRTGDGSERGREILAALPSAQRHGIAIRRGGGNGSDASATASGSHSQGPRKRMRCGYMLVILLLRIIIATAARWTLSETVP